MSGSQERYQIHDARKLPPVLVLPVVVEQLGEDGEVEEGEDEADCLEGDLLDLLTVGGRTQLTPLDVHHLEREISVKT